jgi:hypothetical protein
LAEPVQHQVGPFYEATGVMYADRGKAVSVDPTDEEFLRIGPVGRKVPVGMALLFLLLVVAVVKPWPNPGSPAAGDSPSPAAASVSRPSPTALEPDRAQVLCDNTTGWTIVADEGSFLTSLVPDVEYSTVPPIRSTVPVTSLSSSTVIDLAMCVPPDVSGNGQTGWSGTLWLIGGDPAEPSAPHAVARLQPSPESLGALAAPLDESVMSWGSGNYMLEARFEGSETEAWLGLAITTPGDELKFGTVSSPREAPLVR